LARLPHQNAVNPGVTETGQTEAVIAICINRTPVDHLQGRAAQAVVHPQNHLAQRAARPVAQVHPRAARQKAVHQKRARLPRRKAVRIPMMTGMKQFTKTMITIGTDTSRIAIMQMAWMMRWMSWIGKSFRTLKVYNDRL
jgi:hypothetical protein